MEPGLRLSSLGFGVEVLDLGFRCDVAQKQ